MSQEDNLVKPKSNLPLYWIKEKKTASILCLLTGVVILVITAFIVIHSQILQNNNNNHLHQLAVNKNAICDSPQCVRETVKILNAIDFNVNPCDNFYDFACGNFVSTTQIPDDKNEVDSLTEIHDEVQLQLQAILEGESNATTTEVESIKLARSFYKSCMNETRLEERSVEPFLQTIDTFGGWPVLKGDAWNPEWDYLEAIGKMRNNGYPTSYLISVTVTILNSAHRRLNVGQPEPGIDRKYLIKGLNDTTVKLYYKLMVDLAVLLGANKTQAEVELLNTLKFEIEIANISLPRDHIDANPFQYTLDGLQRIYPYIPWRKYLTYMLPSTLMLEKNEVVWARPPTYLEQLEQLLNKTSNRTIANYMMWRTVLFSSEYLTDEIRNKRVKFDLSTSLTRQVSRWKECVERTNLFLSKPMGYTYIRRHFSDEIRQDITEMLDMLKKEFENMVNSKDWMDNITKEAALLKIKTLAYSIGFPEQYSNGTAIDEYYKNFTLSHNDDLLQNVVKLNKFNVDKNFHTLVEKIEALTFSPSTVNAFHHGMINTIVIPAAILRGRLYSKNRPRYLNFGAIGQILGHELTHGFGEYGSHFFLKGNYFKWWQGNTSTEFTQKIKCLIEQYGNFTVSKLNQSLNAVHTQEEDQADNGGFKLIYNTFLSWLENHKSEPLLPLLSEKYSVKQIFWLSAAQSWCATIRNAYLNDSIQTDKHSPKRYRILGSFKNIEGFSKDFNCPVGSAMNPATKCDIW